MTTPAVRPGFASRAPRLIWAAAAFGISAIGMTWPVGSSGLRLLPDSNDAYFSVWRLGWVGHQLEADPLQLFNANIFFPTKGTLAYSDAMLLLGIIASPLQWAGLHLVVIHNLLLILSFVAAGLGAYLLCMRLTGDPLASFLGGFIFAFAPFRFAHIGHLELLWTAWMPLSLWLVHALVAAPRVRTGALLGICVGLQMLCSIYYGVFLGLYVGLALTALCVLNRRRITRALLVPTGCAVFVALVVTAPYLVPYARTSQETGPRSETEIVRYSASLSDYARVPVENRLYGRRDSAVAADERRLMPGVLAMVLASVAVFLVRSGTVGLYAVLAALSLEASLGVHGWTFPALQWMLPPLQSLRSPARFGALVLLSISVLAALGLKRIFGEGSSRRRGAVFGLAVVVCVAEYCSVPLRTRAPDMTPHPVYRWLAKLPAQTVILELPTPNPSALWLKETTYQYNSIYHWRLLVNGYSGFAPMQYLNTLQSLQTFPDEESVMRLRRLSVDFVLLHREYLGEERYVGLMKHLTRNAAFVGPWTFGAGLATIQVFQLRDRERADEPR